MASTGEGPPKPLDTKNDYDGRSLLEVVQSEGRLRPSTWPETDEPPIHTTPVTQPATALDEADKALIPHGVRIAGHDSGIYQTTWQANALGFVDFTVYEYWLETAAARLLQPYFWWRRNLPTKPNVPRMAWLFTKTKELSQSGWDWALDQPYPQLPPGKPMNPTETLGVQTIRAAGALMEGQPDRFPRAADGANAVLQRSPDTFLLALCAVKSFWLRRNKDGEKFTTFRKRASRTQNTRPLELISEDLVRQAEAAPASSDNISVPGVPDIPGPKPVEAKKPSPLQDPKVKRGLVDAVRALSTCQKKQRAAKKANQDSFEHDALHFATLAAQANLLDNMADAEGLTWPALSEADEDEILRYCKEIRGAFDIGPKTSIKEFPAELTNHQLSSIFDAQAHELRVCDDKEEDAKFDLIGGHSNVQQEAAAEIQASETEAMERKRLHDMLQQTATGGASNPDLVSVEEAAKFLLLDWDNAIINEKNPHLKYKPHQLSAICTIIDALNSPKRFIFLAMACGVGKTVIYVAAVLYRLRRAEQEARETGQKMVYRPHIVLTLSQLAPSTFSQITEFFPGDFDFRLVYGDARSEKNTFRKQQMLSTAEFIRHYKKLNLNNPQTGRTIYVTSYQTFLMRFCTAHEGLQWAELPTSYRSQRGLTEDPGDEKRRYSYVSINNIDLDFETVVCDEAHVLKNENARVHQVVAALNTQVRIFSSATPMLNHPGDLYAYLLLAFGHIPMPEMPMDFPAELLYDVDNFNPFSMMGTQPYTGASGDEMPPCPVRGPCHSGRIDAHADVLRDAMNVDQRLWMYSHELFGRVAEQKKWVYDHCVQVIKPIIKSLFLRHDMTTTTQLPNGQYVTPGDEIKPSECHTTSLFLRGRGKALYKKWEKRLQPMLYQQGGVGGTGEEEARTAVPQHVPQPGNPKEASGPAEPPKINPGVWRKLLLLAQNPNNAKMLRLDEWWEARDEGAGAPTPEELTEAVTAISLDAGDAPADALPDPSQVEAGEPEATRTKRKRRPAKPAAMGTEETSRIIERYRDGGMMEIFRTTVRDDTMPDPEDRMSMLKFLIADSPMYAASLILAIETKRAPPEWEGCDLPNRLVIMVDTPWAQQEATILYNLLGWKVYNIRSSQSSEERQFIVDMFNAKDADIDVLITNPRLSSAGVDMHRACCRGQIWTLTWNANNIQQMRGRLVRLGQLRTVKWDILVVGNTLFERLGLLVDRKYTRQMSAESTLNEKGHWGIGIMYELLAMVFGQPFSRWIIEVLEPGVGAYENATLIAVANATSEIVRLGLGDKQVAQFLRGKNPVEIVGAGARLVELRALGQGDLDLEFVIKNASYSKWGDDTAPKLEDEEAEQNFKDAIEKIQDGIVASALGRGQRSLRRSQASTTKQAQEAADEIAGEAQSSTGNLFKTRAQKTYKSAAIVVDSKDESDAADLLQASQDGKDNMEGPSSPIRGSK